MPEYSRDQLRSIKTFPQLVKYLRDELEWPVETDSFDDLTFDYEPSELGIDTKTAAKIDSIKQLRPLVTGQPWGIFFVKFEPKRLPVVALRRILSQLVVKKRASALTSERAAWNLHDLLFISNYGEGEERQITFAQFSQDHTTADLPTLKVLGWDDSDTVLHIDHVHETLNARLHWPEDDSDLQKWREQWSAAFTIRHREVITTSKDLAIRLADLARGIRRRAAQVLTIETDRGHLRKLHKAFKDALIHDLSEGDFADMYAQTIAYGLLAARVSRPMGIIADNVADMVPITNPFLKEMLGTFLTVGGRKGKIDFDELGIQDVVELLNSPDTHMEAILRDFGRQVRQEDPVIHFYELFLREYDSAMKVKRGVFYTPQPVVSYIVRSVHELLQTEFGLEDGLASTITWGEMAKKFSPRHQGEGGVKIPDGVSSDEPFVLILDPATGTATFIVEVIDVIYKTMVAKWKKAGKMDAQIQGDWNEYVPKHLLPRVYGYELMMAPYAIAHMKVGLKLFETGYRFGSEKRVHIYLTNALEPPHDLPGQLELMAPSLAHEAKAVNAVKSKKRFTVIVGNPPYSGEGMNKGDWIRSLIDTYMYVDGAHLGEKGKKNWLQDDYVKFIRYAQFELDKTKLGILGFVNNHSFLDNPTFRGMRDSLRNSFPRIHVLDLHGNSKKLERCPDDTADENVFDIQQGVSIGFFRRTPETANSRVLAHVHLWGLRGDASKTTHGGKYAWLACNSKTSTDWIELSPNAPFYLFVPQDIDLRSEYEEYWKLTDVMPHFGAGIITSRDHFVIDFEDAPLLKRLELFRDSSVPDEWIRSHFEIKDNSMWSMEAARIAFQKKPIQKELFVDVLYRPYDKRRIYFETNVVFNMRIQIMRHLLRKDNLAFITTRQTKETWSVLVSRDVVAHKATALYDVSSVFPLFLHDEDNRLSFEHKRRSNFAPSFLPAVCNQLGSAASDLVPEDIFHYAYAVFHSPAYRTRYAEFLKIDFPRLPLTASLDLFHALGKLGGELVALHLMESPKLDKHMTRFINMSFSSVIPASGVRRESLFKNGSGQAGMTNKNISDDGPVVEKVSYSDNTVWIDKAKTQGFKGAPENVWNFQIGGYQVCEKWLKDRKGRTLSADDINHYHRIVVALNETIRIMDEIDKVIDQHGGWPNAFLDEKKDKTAYEVEMVPEPLLKAAEETATYFPQEKAAIPSKFLPSTKDDWKIWLALSKWVKERMSINVFWGDFALDISNKLKTSSKISDKEKSDMKKCWKQAVKKGFGS